MNKLLLFLLLVPTPCFGQDIELQIGIGKPVLNNDIFSSQAVLWNSQEHTVMSAKVIFPFKNINLEFWHHSLAEDPKDAGVSGISLFYKKRFTLW